MRGNDGGYAKVSISAVVSIISFAASRMSPKSTCGHPLRAPLRLLASPYAVRRGRRLLCLKDGFSGLINLVSEVPVLDGGVVD